MLGLEPNHCKWVHGPIQKLPKRRKYLTIVIENLLFFVTSKLNALPQPIPHVHWLSQLTQSILIVGYICYQPIIAVDFLHIPLYKTITTPLFLHLIIAARESQLARFPQFPSSSSVYSLNLDLFLTDKINWGFSRCFDLDSVESLLFQSGREFDEVSLIRFFLCFIFLPISISISCNRLSLFLS